MATVQEAVITKSATVLVARADYYRWFNQIKQRAERDNVWKYLDPTVKDEDIPLLEEPTEPYPGTIKADARSIADLDAPQITLYTALTAEYTRKEKAYTRAKRSINEIANHIDQTLAPVHWLLIEHCQTTREKLVKIKTALQPTVKERERDVRVKLDILRKYNKKLNIESWIGDWRNAMQAAKDLDMPEGHKYQPHYEFVNAIEKINQGCAESLRSKLIDAEIKDEEPPTFDSTLNYFRTWMATKPSSTVSYTNSAFAVASSTQSSPSFQGSEIRSKPPSPCICGKKHWYADCYYLIESKRPTGWVPNPEIVTKIEKALKNERTQRLIQKARDKAARGLEDSNQPLRKPYPVNLDEGASAQRGSYSVNAAAFSSNVATQTDYRLLHCWILDPGADIHICNNEEDFTFTRPSSDRDYVIAGSSHLPIMAWGSANLRVHSPLGIREMRIHDVALVPSFFTNIVSLHRANYNNIHFDSGRNALYRLGTNEVLFNTKKVGGHWTLVDRPQLPQLPISTSSTVTNSVFAVEHRRFRPSVEPRKPIGANSKTWHRILGHASPAAIAKLATNVKGAEVQMDERAPFTTECDICSKSKAKEIVSRRPEHETPATRPFVRLCFDIITFKRPGLESGHFYAAHYYCTYSKFHLVFTTENHTIETLVPLTRKVFRMILIRYGVKVAFFWSDNETGFGQQGRAIKILCDEEGVTYEPSAERTPAQNGGAESSGRIIILRARAMGLDSLLPAELADELIKKTAYDLNRTPNAQLGWKTPYEVVTGVQPDLSHMRETGRKGYILDKTIPAGNKLQSRAITGYLVGYDSRNIYRLWVPQMNRVVRSRDVSWAEGPDQFYNPTNKSIDEMILDAPEDTIRVIPVINLEEEYESEDELVAYTEPTVFQNNQDATHDAGGDNTDLQHGINPLEEQSKSQKPSETHLPTPSTSKESSLGLTHSQSSEEATVAPSRAASLPDRGAATTSSLPTVSQETTSTTSLTPEFLMIDPNTSRNTGSRSNVTTADVDEENILPTRSRRRKQAHAALLATTEQISGYMKAFAAGLLNKQPNNPTKLHRDQLPPEPDSWKDAMATEFKSQWKAAADTEYNELYRRGTFEIIKREEAGSNQILPLRWVFKYKFDTDGYLTKFKARLVARGDLQITYEETYAATLAARTFRSLMAIVAAFDCEVRQYDAKNAFINARLNDPVFTYMAEGYTRFGHVLKLLFALYGLKISPLLWYRELTNLLRKLGLKKVPGVDCLFTDGYIIVFFYVDDIVAISLKKNLPRLLDFERQLKNAFEITTVGEISWFLGIRVVRNRDEGKLWLTQDSYIQKQIKRFNIHCSRKPATPLPTEDLLLNPTEQKDTERVFLYQQLVGSIGYCAITCRPDVAKAHSKLAEHLANPSQHHIEMAKRVLAYLGSTATLGLQYWAGYGKTEFFTSQPDDDVGKNLIINPSNSGEDTLIFEASSDAAFADDVNTRKSSQGYLFKLFGGAIDWKATLQRSVVRSTTEAELASLSNTATEMIWWKTFFKAIQFDPGHEPTLYCDNMQTVRIVQQEETKLHTKLRHIDVHQHWLRQEVQNKRIAVQWIATAHMPADGLTKLLPKQRQEIFINQLGLVDIGEQIRSGNTSD